MYRLNLQLPPEVSEALKADAEERGMTISTLVRRLIAEHLAASGRPVDAKVKWGGKRQRANRKPKASLPYDDDPAWNDSIARSLPFLERLAAQALRDHDEGRTIELDPDKLP